MATIARTKAQKKAGISISDAKKANAGKTDSQLRAESKAELKGTPTITLDSTFFDADGNPDPQGTKREVSRGKTEISSSYIPYVGPGSSGQTTGGTTPRSFSFQYIDTNGKLKTVSGTSEAEAKASATDIDPKSGFMKLDSVYAPEKPNAITSSSGNARSEESRLGSTITTLSAPGYSTPARNTKYIDDYERSLTSLLAASERDINASADETKAETQGDQKSEIGATSTALARMGGYLGGTAGGQSALLKLSAGHRAELASLESKRQAALTAARSDYSEKRFESAKARVAEAKYYDEELYTRQQDFFDNQRAILGDERTQNNQERDDARSVITNIVANTTGQDFDELDKETQDALRAEAVRAGYPIQVIQNMMARPKALAGKLDQLVKDAAKKGAPASILEAISEADSFAEAATIASPYIAASSASEDYTPVTIPEYDEFVIEYLSTPAGQEAKKQIEAAARTSFTPAQLLIEMKKDAGLRAIYDSTVAKVQAQGSGKATPFTPTEKKKLEQAGLLGATRQKQLDYLFGRAGSGDADIDDLSS